MQLSKRLCICQAGLAQPNKLRVGRVAPAVFVSFVEEIPLPTALDRFTARLTYRTYHLHDRELCLPKRIAFRNHEKLYFVLVLDKPKLLPTGMASSTTMAHRQYISTPTAPWLGIVCTYAIVTPTYVLIE